MSNQSNPGRKSAKPSKLAEQQLDGAAGGSIVVHERPATASALSEKASLNFTRSVKAQDFH